MKKTKKYIVITILLSILALAIYCIIDQNKSASALFETDSKYVKYTLPSGLNIISIDLGGLINSERVNGSYGDATLIEQNGNYLLIDTGDRKLDDNGNEIDNNVLIKFLKSQQVKKLSVFISHYHIDHYAKLEALLKDSYFTIDTIYFPDPETVISGLQGTALTSRNKWYTNYTTKLKDLGAKIVLTRKDAKKGTNQVTIGEAKLQVIWDFTDCNLKMSDYADDKLGDVDNHYINNTSLVTMITYKNKKILMAGDIEERIEEKILQKGLNIKADIFKLSHHGGLSSNLSAFIDKINPVYAYMPNNATSLKNNPMYWQGDRPYSFANFEGITYNENVTKFHNFKEFVDNIGSKTNLYSTLYNGNTLFNISTSGNITVDTTRNYHTLTVKYIDVDTNEQIEDQVKYKFNNRSEYHLEKLNYIKKPIEYVFVNSTYQPHQILSSDETVICSYQKKEIEVNYSTTERTNQDVVVSLKSNTELNSLEGWNISEDKKTLTKVYTENKTEEIETTDLEGYKIKTSIEITNIDKTAPEGEVTYSETKATNKNVTVTITSNEEIQGIEGWTLSQDKKQLTKEYEQNVEEEITIKDLVGNETKISIEIANIDKIAPEGEVTYSETKLTNKNVTVTITSNEEIQGIEGWTLSQDKKQLTKEYEQNTEEEITIKDLVENETKISIEIANIDKIAPEGEVTYSETKPTNKNVTVTITSNKEIQGIESWTLSQDKKQLTKEYEQNTEEEITIKDLVGNETKISIEIANIDKIAPEGEVTYSETKLTNKNVTVTITSNEEIQGIEGWTLSQDKKQLTKEYKQNVEEEITIKDIAGNQQKVNVEIANIDKTAPEGEVTYSETKLTNKNVTVTITSNEEIQGIEGWTLSQDKKQLTKEYEQNTEEEITIKDLVGNETKISIEIANIDKTAPEVEVTYSETKPTNKNVTVTITSNKEIQGIESWTLSQDKKQLTKEYEQNTEEEITIKDLVGNETKISIEIANIDKTAPEVEVTYSETKPTNKNVTVTITSNKEIQGIESWTLSQDKKQLTKEYEQNTEEEITIKDLVGNETKISIEIANIDKIAPKGEVTYSETKPTNKNVTVTITSNKEIQGIESWTLSQDKKQLTKEYEQNTEEEITIKDLVGNETKISIEIANIDKIAPEGEVTYSETKLTNKNVTVTITSNEEIQGIEGWTLSQDKKQLTKEYEQNIEEEITIKDLVGNETKISIEIANIDKIAPEGEVTYSETKLTNKNVTVTITSNEEIQGIEGWTLSQDKKQLTKEYKQNVEEEITIKDIAGNQQKVNVEIANIDKTAPEVEVTYSETKLTNKNVTVTITSNKEIQGIESWTLSQDKKQLTKEYEQNIEEEITIKDIAGNQKRLNIEIANIDKEKPVISGVENGESYIGSVTAIATDTNLETLLLEKDGEKVEEYTNGKEITEEGNYKLTAIDKLGNTTIVNFTIEKRKGELNGNNQIDIGDILLILRHIAQANSNKTYQDHPTWRLEEKRQKVADVNNNNRVDIGDILKIRRYIAAKNSKEVANKHPDWLNL